LRWRSPDYGPSSPPCQEELRRLDQSKPVTVPSRRPEKSRAHCHQALVSHTTRPLRGG
jgi:hypothetical protein